MGEGHTYGPQVTNLEILACTAAFKFYNVVGLWPSNKITLIYSTIFNYSMGGHVCLFFASMFPERVHKLISLDALKLLSAPPDKFPEKMRKVLNTFESIVTKMEQSPRKTITFTHKEAREKLVRNYRGSIDEEHAVNITN